MSYSLQHHEWTVARQAPLSMGFSRREYWSGLPCLPPGDIPEPGIEPTSLMSPALAGGFFTTSTTWHRAPKALVISWVTKMSSFFFWWSDSGWAPGWQLVPRKTKPWWEAWNFQVLLYLHPHPFSRERRRGGNGVTWFAYVVFRKISILCGLGSFLVRNLIHIQGMWYTPIPCGRSSCVQDPPRPQHLYLFIWLSICILYYIL